MIKQALRRAARRSHHWLALALDDREELPTTSYWTVRREVQGTKQLMVDLMFIKSPHTPYHISAVVHPLKEQGGWLVNGGQNVLMAPLVARVEQNYWAHFQRALRPDYTVGVTVPIHGPKLPDDIGLGPASCVEVAKRLVGVHNPDIVAPVQLLNHLWRMRA